MEFTKGSVVQFTEDHKWCGCFGFINEVKGERIMVGIPVPEKGIAYVFCKKEDIEYIGKAVLVLQEGEE